MYTIIDTENNTANVYKDLKMAAKETNCDYRTLKNRLETNKPHIKGNFYVYYTVIHKSKRGNPHFKR